MASTIFMILVWSNLILVKYVVGFFYRIISTNKFIGRAMVDSNQRLLSSEIITLSLGQFTHTQYPMFYFTVTYVMH